MSVALNFDATQIDPDDDFTPIPAGEYVMAIIDSEMKPTKNGAGQYLQLTLQVLEGEYKGRLVWDRLNLINSNQTAVEIARRTLSAICHAVGKLQVSDSAELHDIPMLVRVSVRPADGQYDASNEVKRYKPLRDGAQQTAASNAQATTPQQRPQQRPADPAAMEDGLPW